MSKSGFTTLNRWLGRKNKDKCQVSGKLSKSSTNLSISSTNINEASQLEYNRITPLPAATTNAPFEQTFRITVLLPKDQLYVTRLGARVPLSKLLELVCDNKLLDEKKYEFRNPVDPSQVYSCDLTIGAVGLSEIRLCHKSESYDNFNSDEIIKLHRTTVIRESLSSSEFSSRNSKHTTKTTSPYSSTNSLNSVDSSAVSCGHSAKMQPKMSAPPRKKRAAPRPPSQTVIPEKSALITEYERVEKEQKPVTLESSLATKDFSISAPNLTSSTLLHSDINGNDCNGNIDDCNDVSSGNGSLNSHGYAEDTVLYAQVQKKNALNIESQNKPVVQESCKEMDSKFPEPSPRKRIVQVKKKTAAPPAPPPRNSLYHEDVVSIASTNVSCNSTPSTPLDSPKSSLDNIEQQKLSNVESETSKNCIPMAVPRITTSTTLLNVLDTQYLKRITNDSEEPKVKSNISKVMINRTPTPEPRSLSCEPPEIEHCYETQLEEFKQNNTEDDCVSKQADSGIGEPVPSPIPDSLPPEISTLDVKSHFESSSDDDDMVKVYNFKLGKTLVKPVSETKTLEELTVMNNDREETDSELNIPMALTQATTPNIITETSSWNFSIPISPPPNFADNNFMVDIMTDPKPDTPITPKIMQRPVLNFDNLKQEHNEHRVAKASEEPQSEKSIQTPMHSIVHELSSVIKERGVDSLMRKTDEPQIIESITPNTLSNFSINTIIELNSTKSKENVSENASNAAPVIITDLGRVPSPLSSPSHSAPEDEKLYRKRSSVTSLKQRKSITRSDSFHTTAAPNEKISLNKRTSSQLSLDQMAGNLNGLRSSSELSIAQSPSLQSLEIVKTILNLRKNSLPNSSSDVSKEIELKARRPSEELQFASLELKTSANAEQPEKSEIDTHDKRPSSEETKNSEQEDKPKELPKLYRYSGPPSINFSTWSERPKSQVAIKNEGDYIFGGAKSNTNIKTYRLSTPSSMTETAPIAAKPAPKPATIQRMGIPEKNYKVPIFVKPLQDVVIDKAVSVPNDDKPQSNVDVRQTKRPTVESVLRPQTQVIVNNCNSSLLPRNVQRATSTVESVLRLQSPTVGNTFTLPRANKQRFSAHPTVPGPQLLRTSSTKQQQSDTVNSNESTLPGPQILRSSSIKQQEAPKVSSPLTQTSQAPFGQNTLRRTGFKEKILAKEETEVQNHPSNEQTPTITTIKGICNGGLKPINQKSNSSVTSAKLKLNLPLTNTSATAISNHQDCKTASSSYSGPSAVSITMEAPTLNFKSIASKSAIVTGKSNTLPVSPPPAPPMSSGTQLKAVTKLFTTTRTDDPRDELLAAIRNFNKSGLKKP